MEFTLDELKELKHCINSTIGLRIQYDCVLDEGKRKEDNDKWLADDYIEDLKQELRDLNFGSMVYDW
jgi:hypothetical protein